MLAYSRMYIGCPGDSLAASVCSQPKPWLWPNQLAIVAGNRMIDCAKMIAMIPDVSTFKGIYVLCPP